MGLEDSFTSTARRDMREPKNPFDRITPQASASSSTVMKKGSCEVFINCRGSDTKHKLARTIYHTLDLVGLRAFLDDDELELGDSIPDEIQEAMRTASVHVAIFSVGYADSPWCLAELCYMLKTGTPIIPVFYNVHPYDLRWVGQGKGLYSPAFSLHEMKGRYSSEMLDEWKSALQKVSNFSGFVLNSTTGDEGMLLKSIVNSILRVIKKEPLEVAKHPVGMDKMVEDLEYYIESEEHGQIVGIVGFGGSGKTTIAAGLYNKKRSSFDRSSFLHDVREAASKNALHTIQKKLLQDLRIQTASFDNVKEGKAILADRLKSLCMLIVLDDVDHEDQLDALLPTKQSLESGSLVIVTTRDMKLLAEWGITSIYKIKPLEYLHAKQLFCWHAFLQPFPLEGFQDLVENCIDACNGLPLSLKVLGGQLYGKRSKEYWVSQLHKIRRLLPQDILQRLRVSYDALAENEKEIFLDIACFFIGERRSTAITVWDGTGWSGTSCWQTLHNKCLVEVDAAERIKMNDNLRDLGMEIARTHLPVRIWPERRRPHIMKGMSIRGIKTTGLSEENELAFKEYMEMMKISNIKVGLQLLVVKENEFTQECGELSRGLLWLRWFDFKHGYIPSWLSLVNIRVVELLEALQLEALWEDANRPLELRELLIENAPKLRSIPRSIGRLQLLKRLSLDCEYEGSGLSRLPEEFCNLHSLEHLTLLGCHMLSNLPKRFGDLVNLRHINLSRCLCLGMLPVSFRQLIHLEYLNLSYCVKLAIESDILENITNLQVFDVSGCDKLEVLPHNVTNQAWLVKLDLRSTSSLRDLPASIGQLTNLGKLEIVGCPLLTRLPTSLGNLSSLATLTLDSCNKLESLPITVGQLSGLQTLTIERCPELYEMPSLAGLFSLVNLKVIGCSKIEKIEGLEQLTALQNLLVWTCWMVPGIHGLGGTEQLRTLDLQADNISAFEPCMQTIQIEKWPGEMTISGRSVPGVQSVLDSFTFPGLAMVNSLKKVVDYSYFARWSLTSSETNLSNAAIVCFLVRSFQKGSIVDINGRRRRLDEGEWIVISVLREVSPLLKDGGRSLQASIDLVYGLSDESHQISDEVLDGRLIVGEISSVAEAFKQLIKTLCMATSMN